MTAMCGVRRSESWAGAGVELEGGVDEDELFAILLVDVGEGDHSEVLT